MQFRRSSLAYQARLQALGLVSLALGLPNLALAQGDDCSSATPILGIGAYAFDNASLTNSGFHGAGGCSPLVLQDAFFQWTAAVAGDYRFDTFGTSFDTRLSLHTGLGCSATCLASNDNAQGTLQSEIQVVGVQAGESFLVQVGSFYLFSGPGLLNVSVTNSPCSTMVDDGYEPNQSCATAANLPLGTTTDLVAFQANPDYFRFVLQPGQIFEAEILSDIPGDVDLRLFDANCTVLQADGQALTVQNLTQNARSYSLQVYLDNLTNLHPCARYDLWAQIAQDPCFNLAEDSLEDNDLCNQATPLGNGTLNQLHVSKWDKDIFLLSIPAQSTVSIDALFLHAAGDIDMFLLPTWSYPCAIGTAGYFFEDAISISDNETLVWTNPFAQPQDCYLEIQVYEGSLSSCNDYDLIVQGAGINSLGDRFCNPAHPNSSGVSGTIAGQGSSLASANQLELVASNLPLNKFGYFLTGRTQGIIAHPGGSLGDFCLGGGGTIARFNRPLEIGYSANGGFTQVIDLAQIPEPGVGPTAVLPGETWYFQCWYRDRVGGQSVSNFTDAIAITFQ